MNVPLFSLMRVVLQNLETHLYLQVPDKWRFSVEDATDFETSNNALKTAHHMRESRFEIVLVFEDRSYDIRLPADNGGAE